MSMTSSTSIIVLHFAEIMSISSKILSFSWGIATIVLIANYTAALAGFITAVNISTDVSNAYQLKGKK